MPLWNNEEWRARIGSSWCAIGRPFKCKSSTNHQGNLLGHLLLSIISAERILQCGFLMTMLAIITGYNLLTRLIKRCKGAAKGNFHHTTTVAKTLITVVILLQAFMAVQTSLLMRSGDVEKNPGPDYSSVDNDTILGEDDFSEVYGEVFKLTGNYYTLGIVLGLPVQELSKIKKGFPSDLEQAFTEMLLVWLRHSYNIDKHGPPTWRRLVEAVDNDAGGSNPALAKKIASNHPAVVEPSTNNILPSKMQVVPSRDRKNEKSLEETDEPNGAEVNVPNVGRRRTLPLAAQKVRGRTLSTVCEYSNDWESIVHKFRDTLAMYYIRQVDDRAWPPVKVTNFINLALIKDRCGWRKTIRGAADKTVSEGDTASYSTMFNDIEAERFILFEGRPGSGKTTLMNKISRDWACREILTSYLLLHIPLRRLNIKGDRNIQTILQVAYPGLSESDLEQLAVYIEQNQGEGVVFAFDGLDEYAPHFYDPITKLKEELPYGTKKPLRRQLTDFFASSKKQTIDDVFQIVYGKSFTKALVIITSRPSACTQFREYAKKRIEVLGFLKAQITEYLLHYFDKDEHKAKQLSLHLEQHPNLLNMAYLPLHCAMLAFLYEEDTLLPETETEFYRFFTISTLLRDMRKRQGGVEFSLKSFDCLPMSDKAIFDKICQLAFTATVKSKQVFSADDVKSISTFTDDGGSLGLVVIDHCFTRYGLDDTYTFLHLTFQEYLAAVHITGLTVAQQLELIKKHRNDKHLSVVWKFLCGQINFSNPNAMDIFKSVLDTAAAKDKLIQLQCCHESQNPLVCKHVITASKAQLKFRSTNFTPSDSTAIGYAVHECDVEPVQLVFQDCNLSYEGATALLKKIEDHPVSLTLKKGPAVKSLLQALAECTTPGLHYLVLSGNNIDCEDAEILGKGLKNCTNIIKLDLSDSKIDADGAQELAYGLEFCTELQELDLSKNYLTDEGIMALSNAIGEMESLQKLNLSKNDISSKGVEPLTEGIEKLKALQQLSLNKNLIDDEGAIALVEMIEETTCLQCLELNYNYIGKDGVEAISAIKKEIKIHLNNQYRGL